MQLALHLLQPVGDDALAVDEAVCIVDKVYQLVAEPVAAQPHQVDATILSGLLAGDDVWRNVLAEAAPSLNHDVSANLAELMAEHGG